MKKQLALLSILAAALSQSAAAHHLDDYDARIRRDADLPAAWFKCQAAKDCELVSVPCQSDLAVAARYKTEAREALVKEYPFCLGSSLHDTEASCEKRECVTKGTKPSNIGKPEQEPRANRASREGRPESEMARSKARHSGHVQHGPSRRVK